MLIRQRISWVCFFLFPLVAFSADEPSSYLKYEPARVSLKGRLVEKVFFGPPGYGEDPKNDRKERQYILILNAPINLEADRDNPSEKNVREVTIVVLDFKKVPVKRYLDKAVRVDGTLFHAVTGHHNTPVLITASRVEPQ